MKTQAELLEFAMFTTQNESATDFERELAADYLRLTNPTKLTAEHCRAAGGLTDLGDVFIGDGITVWTENDEHPDAIRVEPATVGLLYAAQRQEESR